MNPLAEDPWPSMDKVTTEFASVDAKAEPPDTRFTMDATEGRRTPFMFSERNQA